MFYEEVIKNSNVTPVTLEYALNYVPPTERADFLLRVLQELVVENFVEEHNQDVIASEITLADETQFTSPTHAFIYMLNNGYVQFGRARGVEFGIAFRVITKGELFCKRLSEVTGRMITPMDIAKLFAIVCGMGLLTEKEMEEAEADLEALFLKNEGSLETAGFHRFIAVIGFDFKNNREYHESLEKEAKEEVQKEE
jgi:hypothetical protein